MEVELFAWIVLVDGLATSLNVVDAVFDAVDGAGDRIFSNTY